MGGATSSRFDEGGATNKDPRRNIILAADVVDAQRAGPSVQCGRVLVATEYRPLRLAKVHQLNYNTKLFRFKFPTHKSEFELPVASLLMVRAWISGEAVERP